MLLLSGSLAASTNAPLTKLPCAKALLHVRGGASPFRGPVYKLQPSFHKTGQPSNPPTSYRASRSGQLGASARVVTDLSQRDSRVGFIRKVYGILGAQLLVMCTMGYRTLKPNTKISELL